MKAVQEVLVKQFYRRNFLFFLLASVLLFLVFRPPTLLISPVFVTPMLEDNLFLGIVLGLLGLYYIKGIRETFQAIHHRENQFLYTLAVLPQRALWKHLVLVLLQVLAPALVYLMVIVGYSLVKGTWHWIPLTFINALVILGAAIWLTKEVRFPREITVRSGLQQWIEKRIQNSMMFISLGALFSEYSKSVMVIKGITLGLLGLALWGQPMSPKAIWLIFLSLACLQGMLAYNMRKAEDQTTFLLRNLPIPRIRRWLGYLFAGILLFLPETIVWISVMGSPEAIFQGIFFSMINWAVFLLGIAILHHEPLEVSQFLSRLFGFYVFGFCVLLFGIPLWGLSIASILYGGLIFGTEYYKWNGWV